MSFKREILEWTRAARSPTNTAANGVSFSLAICRVPGASEAIGGESHSFKLAKYATKSLNSSFVRCFVKSSGIGLFPGFRSSI